MNMKNKYFYLQMKRSFKKYPAVLLITIVTVCASALCAYGIISQSVGKEENRKISVGIVGDTGDSYLGMGIYALKNIDTSRYAVDFVEMTRQEAEEALQKQDIHGYVDVPPDFIRDVVRGKNTPASYVVRKSALNFGSILTGEITGTVSELITETQTSIYSMQDVARKLNQKKNLGKKSEELNIKYINTILGRSKIFDIRTIGVADNISFGGYYLCGIIMFFMMLWGISCTKILDRGNRSVQRLLCSRGMSTFWQIMCEYASYFAITLLTIVIFAVLFAVFAPQNLPVAELSGVGLWSVAGFVIKIVPVVMMVCSLHTVIYEAVSSTVAAVLLQFVVSAVLGYISGFFYPEYFFPDFMRSFASVLPSGVGFAYIRRTVSGLGVIKELWMCIAYFAGFIALTVTIRKRKTEGDIR